jgi:hypothetical protein
VTQAFSVPEMFAVQGDDLLAQFVAAPIHDLAEPPARLQRTLPLALPYPFALTTSIDVRLPNDVPMGTLNPVRVDDGNLEFTVSRLYAERRLQVRYAVVYKRDAVPAGELAAYARTLREVRTKVAYRLTVANGVELARRRAVESRQLQGLLHRAVVADVQARIEREREVGERSLSDRTASTTLERRELTGAPNSRRFLPCAGRCTRGTGQRQ